MAWVSPKVYAILKSSEEGKDILEGIAEKDQAEVDKEVDAFFGKGGKGEKDANAYTKAKMDDKEEENAYQSMGDEEAKKEPNWKTTKMASGTIHELGEKRIIEEENEKGDIQYRIGGTNGKVFSSLEEAKNSFNKVRDEKSQRRYDRAKEIMPDANSRRFQSIILEYKKGKWSPSGYTPYKDFNDFIEENWDRGILNNYGEFGYSRDNEYIQRAKELFEMKNKK